MSRQLNRYLISGIGFTAFGPTVFWLLYPVGATKAIVIAELVIHSIRYTVFKLYVFRGRDGYEVTLIKYILSTIPVVLVTVLTVVIFQRWVGREYLTILTTIMSAALGFLVSKGIYKRSLKGILSKINYARKQ